MKKVYCFGNESLPEDSLAKTVAETIRVEGYEFVKCDNPDKLLDEEGEIIIMDVAKGNDDVRVFTEIEKIEAGSISSLHDFDLGFWLRLMKELGKIGSVKIIALPMQGEFEEIIPKVEAILKSN